MVRRLRGDTFHGDMPLRFLLGDPRKEKLSKKELKVVEAEPALNNLDVGHVACDRRFVLSSLHRICEPA